MKKTINNKKLEIFKNFIRQQLDRLQLNVKFNVAFMTWNEFGKGEFHINVSVYDDFAYADEIRKFLAYTDTGAYYRVKNTDLFCIEFKKLVDNILNKKNHEFFNQPQ